MIALVYGALLLTAVCGTLVVLSRDPRRQVFALSANGAALAVLFFVMQAPDVALSEIAVGSAVVPLMVLVTLTAIARDRSRR